MIDWDNIVAPKLVAPNSGQTIIYGLVDPRTLLVRYVGRSSTGVQRPRQHRRRAAHERNHKASWIRSLLALGLDYTIVVLEVVHKDALDSAERFWIAYGNACGWPLTNHTAGGEGSSGRVLSSETLAKMSAAQKGRKRPRAQVEASARGHIGLRPSPAHLAKLRGRKQTPEHVAKRAAARRGKPCSPDTKAKIAAALRARKQ